MSATTDSGTVRHSPARWSKLTATTLSAGALLGIVHALSAIAAEPAVMPSSGTGAGGGLPVIAAIQSTRPAPAAVPAPLPPPPSSAAPVVPQGVSKASGG
ncbi:hypothetical protein QDT91_29010 (plasmid) [Mycolicibacterium aubagnense]|uniref:hypothetical protein n=1 Tax=Mycolicibacterium aubagnense TaxID=319707 RepID=UPI00244DFCBD|nr:hypothetical protein [Mycolicibacterium aubagnense]WGI36043.1 hypothetical protein QDT91_29010 [Mycolicibacterium aubagnense]